MRMKIKNYRIGEIMTLNELTQNAIDFIVETQKDNDYICEQMLPEWCETHCIDHLRQGCVIEFLTNMYEPEKEK